MIENEFSTAEAQVGGFTLEEGGTIPGLQLACATVGTLNDAKDNAILIPTWFSSCCSRRSWAAARPALVELYPPRAG